MHRGDGIKRAIYAHQQQHIVESLLERNTPMYSHLLSHTHIQRFVIDNQAEVKAVALVGPKGALLDAYTNERFNTTIDNSLTMVSSVQSMFQVVPATEVILDLESEYDLFLPLDESIMMFAVLHQEANVGMMRYELQSLCDTLQNLD